MPKSKKKKETQKEAGSSFIEAIRKLREAVRKELDKERGKKATKPKPKPKSKPKPEKKVDHTKRTESVKEQLKKSDTKFPSDAEKRAEEKRKGK